MALNPNLGGATIKVLVDGGELAVRGAAARIREVIKATDPITVQGKTITIELSRRDADAARVIADRVRRALDDVDADIEIDD